MINEKKKFKEPVFPTQLHRDAAEITRDHFLHIPAVDTILVVNSCARGQAIPESDLDIAILVKPGTPKKEMKKIETGWNNYAGTQRSILQFKQSTPFSHLHLDVIDAKYKPGTIQNGEPIDYFEVEIGNQVCYSAPMNEPGAYFKELQKKWLPYYNNELRLQRLIAIRDACEYNLDHIPFFLKRQLYFQAFDILYKAFQEYLQTLFIVHRTYPLAYNKWIRMQIVEWLNRPELYPKLSPVLSVTNIESNEINGKAMLLSGLLNDLVSMF